MIAGLVLVAQLADLAAFLVAVRAVGLAGEANPLVHGIVGVAGLEGLAVAKIAGALVLAAIASRVRRRYALIPAAVGTLGAATALGALL